MTRQDFVIKVAKINKILGELKYGIDIDTILDFSFLMEEDDRFGGDAPFRTYHGMRYKGGYSDHLPVLLELEISQP